MGKNKFQGSPVASNMQEWENKHHNTMDKYYFSTFLHGMVWSLVVIAAVLIYDPFGYFLTWALILGGIIVTIVMNVLGMTFGTEGKSAGFIPALILCLFSWAMDFRHPIIFLIMFVLFAIWNLLYFLPTCIARFSFPVMYRKAWE